MPKRIAVVGAGALGGYAGGTLAHLGHDVTLIDPWPEHVEIIRKRGLELDGLTPEEKFTVKPRILHLTEVQALAKTPVDVAIVAMKSYDTLWATALIAPYLSEQGFVLSLQNCMNEETIAGVVGWGRTVGAVASMISVDLYEAGRIRRTMPKGGDKYTIFRIGEPHGRITPRVEELVKWFSGIDSAKATTNLWGERWSKLVQNSMGNGVTAATGLTSPACLGEREDPPLPDRARRRGDPRRPGARLHAREGARAGAREIRARRGRRQGGAGGSRSGPDSEARRQSARRHPAAVDGAGHPQGPAHRDRRDERLHRAQGQGASAWRRRATRSSPRSLRGSSEGS
jgi:2-dehydropantoate 2-reductase